MEEPPRVETDDLPQEVQDLIEKLKYEFKEGVRETLDAYEPCTSPDGEDWLRLFEAAEAVDFEAVNAALVTLCQQHSAQEIEYWLRREKSRVLLIARNPPRWMRGVENRIGQRVVPFFLFVSTRQPLEAMQELLVESDSYAENFAKLAETGIQCAVDEAAFRESVAEAPQELFEESDSWAENFAKLAETGIQCAVDESTFRESVEEVSQSRGENVNSFKENQSDDSPAQNQSEQKESPDFDIKRVLEAFTEMAESRVCRDENGHILLQNTLYPLTEDELQPRNAFLAEAHGSGPMSSVEVTLSKQPTVTVPRERESALCELARSELQAHCSYSSFNYPTRNLTHQACLAYNHAVEEGSSLVRLQNHCCTREDCPQIVFQKLVLEAI